MRQHAAPGSSRSTPVRPTSATPANAAGASQGSAGSTKSYQHNPYAFTPVAQPPTTTQAPATRPSQVSSAPASPYEHTTGSRSVKSPQLVAPQIMSCSLTSLPLASQSHIMTTLSVAGGTPIAIAVSNPYHVSVGAPRQFAATPQGRTQRRAQHAGGRTTAASLKLRPASAATVTVGRALSFTETPSRPERVPGSRKSVESSTEESVSGRESCSVIAAAAGAADDMDDDDGAPNDADLLVKAQEMMMHADNDALRIEPTETPADRRATPITCERRYKQLLLGYERKEYARYLREVPRDERQRGNKHHPFTPRHDVDCPSRRFKNLCRAWRRCLHEWCLESMTGPASRFTENVAVRLPEGGAAAAAGAPRTCSPAPQRPRESDATPTSAMMTDDGKLDEEVALTTPTTTTRALPSQQRCITPPSALQLVSFGSGSRKATPNLRRPTPRMHEELEASPTRGSAVSLQLDLDESVAVA